MFYNYRQLYTYSSSIDKLDGTTNVFFPIEVDTEFTHYDWDINNPDIRIQKTITVQCRSITKDKGIIYAHEDYLYDIPRHKRFTRACVAFDYLVDNGYSVTIKRYKSLSKVDLPYFEIDFYGFFLLAELERIFHPDYLSDIRKFYFQTDKQGCIRLDRRLRSFRNAGAYQDYLDTNWIITISGQSYIVRLSFFDTSAVHGHTNYATFCSNSGITLEYKDSFTKSEKVAMDKVYFDRPEEFDNYALGDLHNYDALLGNIENFKKIYESLGLSDYFTVPRLTIGSTVCNLVIASIKNLFGVSDDDKNIIKTFCLKGSADYIKHNTSRTGCLNAKVDGGRCRNNRPTDTVVNGVVCDIDISSCYGDGLRTQDYPLGIPVIIDYPIDSDINKYETLRTFRKKYGKELVPGLWQARLSTIDGYQLKYKQDFLMSWFPPKDISQMVTDSEFTETDEWWTVDNVGEIKILNNQINNAVITHEFLQWLDNVASPKQREEMLDNLYVITAMFYPASDRVNSINELIEAHAKHNGVNTSSVVKNKGRTRKVDIGEDCHKWYAVNVGHLLVDKLLQERKKHAKNTSFNVLYKLCVNTVYGDMVSPYFKVGNVIVGNNITARARALAWYMEKGLHGYQSITDGCAFDLNKVVIPKDGKKINGYNTVSIYNDRGDGNIKFTSLGFNETGKIELSVTDNKPYLILDGKPLTPDDSLSWVNQTAMEHLRSLFAGVDVLHSSSKDVKGKDRIGQFEFEVKTFYEKGTFHGSANYSLSASYPLDNEGNTTLVKMRSYSKHGHKLIELDEELKVTSTEYLPSKEFLTKLYAPNCITRSNPFIKSRILKLGDYHKNYSSWKDSKVFPGCTVETSGLLREFSLTQYTYKSYEQYKSWRREYERLLNKYGQSYEMFFLNDDGTLRYQEMIETINQKILNGNSNFFEGIDKRIKHIYREYLRHAKLECLERTREALAVRYHGVVVEDPQTDLS